MTSTRRDWVCARDRHLLGTECGERAPPTKTTAGPVTEDPTTVLKQKPEPGAWSSRADGEGFQRAQCTGLSQCDGHDVPSKTGTLVFYDGLGRPSEVWRNRPWTFPKRRGARTLRPPWPREVQRWPRSERPPGWPAATSRKPHDRFWGSVSARSDTETHRHTRSGLQRLRKCRLVPLRAHARGQTVSLHTPEDAGHRLRAEAGVEAQLPSGKAGMF